MITKFTNSMCAHVWAQQKQQYGEGSNMRFEGPVMYSYGTTVAIHYGDFILVSADNMTPTTTKHLYYVRRAVSDKRVILTNLFKRGYAFDRSDITGLDLIKDQIAKMNITIETAKRRMCRYRLQSDIDLLHGFKSNIEFLETQYNIIMSMRIPTFSYLLEKLDTLKEKDSNREAKKQEKDKAQFIQWLNGELVQFPRSWDRRDGSDYITLRGETVITSRGAIAPLSDVKIAVRFYTSTPWPYFGRDVKLGEFVLNKIDVDGNVTAGCHTFTASEIERFIQKWGV